MIAECLISPKIPASYRSLIEQCKGGDLFSNPYWIENFLQTVVSEQDEVVWIGCKSDTGEALLLLPLWWQSGQPFWRGKRLKSLANYYTTLYQPLHAFNDPGQLAEALNVVVQHICQLDWDVLELGPLDPTSECYSLLIELFKKQRKYIQPYFMYGNWYFLLPKSNEQTEYKARPKTIKRRLKELKKHIVEFQIYTEKIDSNVGLQYFIETYGLRWKKNEPYPDFIPGLVKMAANHGWLRLGIVFINGEVAASQLWFVLKNTAYIFKIAQNSQLDVFSPGTLLTAYLMEHVINVDQVQKVDFLSGDDGYKKDWMSHRGERWGLQITNPLTFLGFLKMTKSKLSQIVKKYSDQLAI